MNDFHFQTLREQILTAIRNKILNAELTPGTRIIEQKLAEEFGSSRGPVREALRQLEQEGLVEYSRNAGCSVRNVTPEDAYELYLLRANLEITALHHYNCRFTDDELTTLQTIVDEMRLIPFGNLQEIAEKDNRFHRLIVKKAALPRLLKYWEELNYGSLIAGVVSNPYHENLAKRQSVVHTQLLEVLAQRDTEKACRAVYDHYILPLEQIMEPRQ